MRYRFLVAKQCYDDPGPRWRVWNEGFAHFVADEHFRDLYPPGATVDEDWSGFREEGKRLVSELVGREGREVLRRVPTHWLEFDAQVASQEGST